MAEMIPVDPPYRDPAWLPASQVDCYRAGWEAARKALTQPTRPAEGDALRRLIAKWRDEAVKWQRGIGDNQNTRLFTECANELEATLAPLSGPADASGQPAKARDKRLEWFLRAHPREVIEAYAEDGSLHEAIAAAIEKVEDDWIRITTQNAKDAKARAAAQRTTTDKALIRAIASDIVLHVRRGAWHTTEVEQFITDAIADRLVFQAPPQEPT